MIASNTLYSLFSNIFCHPFLRLNAPKGESSAVEFGLNALRRRKTAFLTPSRQPRPFNMEFPLPRLYNVGVPLPPSL